MSRAGLAAFCMVAAAQACAQGYPAKPVRFVIPFPPGGGNDIVGRMIAGALTERLGKQVVVDNRAGGNSIVGSEFTAHAAPDGYTLLIISTSFSTNPIIHKLPYDSLKSFEWVAMLGVGINVLTVNPGLPARNVRELIALAKARPGQINYASTGVGSNAHFGTELFKHMAGIDMVHVPYKGAGPALVDAISGQAQLMLGTLIQSMGYIRGHRLRALGVSSTSRSDLLPDVPTIAEAGVPGYETLNWWGLVAPRGTPQAIVQRLHQELGAVLKSPDIATRMRSEGAQPHWDTPDALGRYVAAEIGKWTRLAKVAGIRGE